MMSWRTKIFFLNLAKLVVGKGGVVLAGFIMVPLIISLDGLKAYGVWAICGQLLAYVAALDLGMGLALQNRVSHAIDASRRGQISATAGWFMLLLAMAGAGFVAIVFIICALVPGVLTRFSDGEIHRAQGMVLLVAITIGIALPAQIPIRMLSGLQKQGEIGIIQGGVALIALLAIPLSVWMGFPLLAGLSFAVLAPVVIPSIWSWYRLTDKEYSWLLPRLTGDRSGLRSCFYAGFAFFISQIAALAVFQTDILVIGISEGPVEAARFSTCAKLLAIPLLIQGVILTALWPAFAQAAAQSDIHWIRIAYRRLIMITFLGLMPGALLLAVFSPQAIDLWTGSSEAVPRWGVVCGYLVFVLSSLWANPHAQGLNAVGRLRLVTIVALVQGILNVVAVLLAVRIWGSEGVVWASVGCAILTSVLFLPMAWKRWLSKGNSE